MISYKRTCHYDIFNCNSEAPHNLICVFPIVGNTERLRCSRGSVLAFITKNRRLKPGRNRRIFRAKNPQHAFLQRGSKAVGPISQIFGI